MDTGLSNLKRPELQRLAKQHGIKANQKSEKLIEELQTIFKSEGVSAAHISGIEYKNVENKSDGDSLPASSLKETTPLESDKENTIPYPIETTGGISDAFMSEEETSTDINCSSTEKKASASRVRKRGRTKKQSKNLKRTPEFKASSDADTSKDGFTNVAKKSPGKTKTASPKKDSEMTIDAIQPPWDDHESDRFLDSSVECAAPAFTRKTTARVSKPAVSARRSSNSTETGKDAKTGSGRSGATSAEAEIKQVETTTPKNNTTQPMDKTFSIPKNRTKSRTSVLDKTRNSATKRKMGNVSTPVQNKLLRSTEKNWRNNLKRAVENASLAPQLSSGMKTPLFAAEGVTVANTKTKSTPGKYFAKAHEKRFGKLESIDDYQKRKEERAERLLGTGKKSQALSRLAQPRSAKIALAADGRPKPNILTPVNKKTNRPKPNILTPVNKNTAAQSRKTSIKAPTTFKPTVTTTSKIETNFATRASKLITPKKVAVSFAKSPNKPDKTTGRTPSANKTPTNKGKRPSRASLTPFRPAATPQSAKKKAFNLQESLKKNLPYVPHKGPLAKFQDTAKQAFHERLKNVKNPKIKTREMRRKANASARKNAKSDLMMKRRGVKVS